MKRNNIGVVITLIGWLLGILSGLIPLIIVLKTLNPMWALLYLGWPIVVSIIIVLATFIGSIISDN